MDQCGHIHTLLHWTPHPKLGLHLLEANLSTKTEDALNMHTSASLQETGGGHQQRTVVCRCSFSVACSQKHRVYDNTSDSFCRLGISLGKPRSRCAQTAWKGPGNDVTYISDGAFGDRTKKEGQLQPTAPLFQLPWSKQHQPENALCFSLICPFSTKTSCWLPPDLAGSLIPIPRTGTAPLGCWSFIQTWASWTPFLQDCSLSSRGPDTPFPRTSKTTHGRIERTLQLMASPLLSSLLPVIH